MRVEQAGSRFFAALGAADDQLTELSALRAEVEVLRGNEVRVQELEAENAGLRRELGWNLGRDDT